MASRDAALANVSFLWKDGQFNIKMPRRKDLARIVGEPCSQVGVTNLLEFRRSFFLRIRENLTTSTRRIIGIALCKIIIRI